MSEEIKESIEIEEGYWYEGTFYHDIVELAEDLFPEVEEVNELPDDWSIEVEVLTLQPVHQFTMDELVDRIDEYRIPDEDWDYNDTFGKSMNEILAYINAKMPKYFYPQNKSEKMTIIKRDLLEIIA